MNQLDTKQALLTLCELYVQQRINTAQQAMEAAQEAANNESKSSAGDKYETGRAMAQIERDRNAQLLAEALKIKRELDTVKIDKLYEVGQIGSVVVTNRGTYFISVGAGKLMVEESVYFAVSVGSPIGAVLLNRKVGDVIPFNKMTYQIQQVY